MRICFLILNSTLYRITACICLSFYGVFIFQQVNDVDFEQYYVDYELFLIQSLCFFRI